MVIRDGNVNIIAGSRDPITFDIYKEKGVERESFSNTSALTLWIKSKTGTIKSFLDPKVTWVDESQGQIKFIPATDDFLNADAGKYSYHFSLLDSGGSPIKFPNPEKYIITIIANLES